MRFRAILGLVAVAGGGCLGGEPWAPTDDGGCFAEAACDTNPSPCSSGYVRCDRGVATCVDGVAVADGTSCGTGLVCAAGVCSEAGSLNLYWDFVRTAPAQPGGRVIYDADLVGTGDSACPESRVDLVTVNSPLGSMTTSCTRAGVQGITLAGLAPGERLLGIQGLRQQQLLWYSTFTVQVQAGRTIDAYVDVAPRTVGLDVVARLRNRLEPPERSYATCAEASNPVVHYEVWDSSGTLVDAGAVGCSAGSPLALPVISSTYDCDGYVARLQGYTGQSDPAFDSCIAEGSKYFYIDTLADRSGAGRMEVDLWSPPYCTPGP